jgi:hypothetical protein
MMDLGASSNVIPFKVCGKLNIKSEQYDIQIIQLDKTKVKVTGALKKILIRMSSNPKIHQTINIIVLDILDTYGMVLSREWSATLKGYFSTDWSHLWLPYNDKPNQIRVDRELYMKHVVNDLYDPNEVVMFNHFFLINYSCDSFFGNYYVETSPYVESNTQSEILHRTQIVEPHYNITYVNSCDIVQYNIVFRDKL